MKPDKVKQAEWKLAGLCVDCGNAINVGKAHHCLSWEQAGIEFDNGWLDKYFGRKNKCQCYWCFKEEIVSAPGFDPKDLTPFDDWCATRETSK